MIPLIISYSNSGRHWLMSILNNSNIIYNKTLFGSNALHKISHNKLLEYYEKNITKDKLKDYKLIFLHRDPRDVVVSNYYHCIYLAKMSNFNHNIDQFIRDDTSGIEKVIKFNLFFKEFPMEKEIISYESLHSNIYDEIKKICVIDDTVRNAIQLSSFENMRQHELKMYPNKTQNEMKVRQGIIGNYINHLSEDDIEYCNDLLEKYNYFERMK